MTAAEDKYTTISAQSTTSDDMMFDKNSAGN